MKLNEEQKDYLKTLNSKKKQRKFFVDCLIENIVDAEVKISISKISDFPSKQEKDNADIVIDKTKEVFDVPKSIKSEEINRLNYRYVTTTAPRTFEGMLNDQANELLKFDMLKDEKCDICKWHPKTVNSNKCKSCDSFIRQMVEKDPIFKNLNHVSTDNFDFDKGIKDAFETRIPKENSEAKYTEKDLRTAYLTGVIDYLKSHYGRKGYNGELLFKNFLKSLKNE